MCLKDCNVEDSLILWSNVFHCLSGIKVISCPCLGNSEIGGISKSVSRLVFNSVG